jgi:putative endonuclease
MKKSCFFVYILLCENGAYYTGYTIDLKRRFEEHCKGTDKCKFTRSFKPLRIETSWEVPPDKSIALKIERYIKKLSKHEKQQLIQFPGILEDVFPDYGLNFVIL